MEAELATMFCVVHNLNSDVLLLSTFWAARKLGRRSLAMKKKKKEDDDGKDLFMLFAAGRGKY